MGVEEGNDDREGDCDYVEASIDCVREGEEEVEDESDTRRCSDEDGLLVYLNRRGGSLVEKVEEDVCSPSPSHLAENGDLFLGRCGVASRVLFSGEGGRHMMGFHSSFCRAYKPWTSCGEVSCYDADSGLREGCRNGSQKVYCVNCMRKNQMWSRTG